MFSNISSKNRFHSVLVAFEIQCLVLKLQFGRQMQVGKNPGMHLILGQKGQAMIFFSAVNNGRNVQDWSPYPVIILPPASETAHPDVLVL